MLNSSNNKTYSFMLHPGKYANLQDIRHDGFESFGELSFDKKVLSFGACQSTKDTGGGSVTFYSVRTLGKP